MSLDDLLWACFSIGLFWLLNQKIDDTYKGALKIASKGDSQCETLVSDLLASKRPTCFQAALLLAKINRLKIKNVK